MPETAETLGLGTRYAHALAHVSWSRYPRLCKLDPIYWSRACRDGGPYDVAPGNRHWPS